MKISHYRQGRADVSPEQAACGKFGFPRATERSRCSHPSIGAGVLTFYRPNQSALAWLWVIGTYAILYGVMMLVLGFKLRNLETDSLPKNTIAHG